MNGRREVQPSRLEDAAAVKLSWREGDEGWRAALTAVDDEGFLQVPLDSGVEFDLDITEDRRCVGYFADVADRRPCPEFRELDTGSRCSSCRRRDVFSGYVEGREAADVAPDVEFSVYFARCGSSSKVGVTRTGKLERRWVEQGADEAAVHRTGLDSREALDLESKLSDRHSLSERIRKEDKVRPSDVSLQEMLEDREIAFEGDVVDVSGRTVYPSPSCSGLTRSGRFAGRLSSVKGQIVSFDGGLCVALSTGRVFSGGEQTGLSDY